MKSLFGVSMTTIAIALAALAVSVLDVVLIWFSNWVMFRLGVRNIPVAAPKRRADRHRPYARHAHHHRRLHQR
ncbi:MAG: hypothetical protein U0531_19435 [Dehalococcoidia bacterium]